MMSNIYSTNMFDYERTDAFFSMAEQQLPMQTIPYIVYSALATE
jgi:hypothetical protein